MPGYKSIARQLTRNFSLPPTDGSGYNWPLAEVMRGLWEEATSNAANNIAETDAMEAAFVAAYSQVPTAIRDRSIEYGRAVGAAVFAGSLNDGGHQGYLTNFPPYAPPVGPGLWVPLPGQAALQPYWRVNVQPLVIPDASACAPNGPPSFSEDQGSEFHAEALEVYDVGNNLTPEQLATANRDPIRITGRPSRRRLSRASTAASTFAQRSTTESIKASASPTGCALWNGSNREAALIMRWTAVSPGTTPSNTL
jgi:hypothetical protein